MGRMTHPVAEHFLYAWVYFILFIFLSFFPHMYECTVQLLFFSFYIILLLYDITVNIYKI